MKRWNKQKKRREACWTQVTNLDATHYDAAVKWCLNREGKRYFSRDYGTYRTIYGQFGKGSVFYFEDGQDATAFYLTWINKPKQVA